MMADERRFEGRVALVTGAASGLGRASALRLADEGARLFCIDADAEGLAETAARARRRGVEIETLLADVGDAEDARRSVECALRRFGRLDVLCNATDALGATFHMCREAIPHLLQVKGSIVNLASAAGSSAAPGVLSLTRSLAVEYGRRGLRVNALCPKWIAVPAGRASRASGGTEAVAGAVAFLASDDATAVNGLELRVGGEAPARGALQGR